MYKCSILNQQMYLRDSLYKVTHLNDTESKSFNTDALALVVIFGVAAILLLMGEPIGFLALLLGVINTLRYFRSAKKEK